MFHVGCYLRGTCAGAFLVPRLMQPVLSNKYLSAELFTLPSGIAEQVMHVLEAGTKDIRVADDRLTDIR